MPVEEVGSVLGMGSGQQQPENEQEGEKRGKSGQFWETVNLVPFGGNAKAWCSVSLG